MRSSDRQRSRSAFRLLIAATVASASLPSWAAPGLGFDDRGTSSGLSGRVELFRLDHQGLKPLPDLMQLMATMPTPPATVAVPPPSLTSAINPGDPALDAISDVPTSQLGPVEDGSLLALQDFRISDYSIAQRPTPPRPTRPPAPITPTPAPTPAPPPAVPLANAAVWTVVIVAGVAVAILVASGGPTPPISR
ncbi:MAG: hypothetical protein ACK52U_17200 [Synechococcaceae cyanobacterium]|jgi:hypothetical protein